MNFCPVQAFQEYHCNKSPPLFLHYQPYWALLFWQVSICYQINTSFHQPHRHLPFSVPASLAGWNRQDFYKREQRHMVSNALVYFSTSKIKVEWLQRKTAVSFSATRCCWNDQFDNFLIAQLFLFYLCSRLTICFFHSLRTRQIMFSFFCCHGFASQVKRKPDCAYYSTAMGTYSTIPAFVLS